MKILIFRINSYVKFKANIIVKYWNFPALLLNLDSYGKMKIYKSIVKILHPFESRKRYRMALSEQLINSKDLLSLEKNGWHVSDLTKENLNRVKKVRELSYQLLKTPGIQHKTYLDQYHIDPSKYPFVEELAMSNQIISLVSNYLSSYPVLRHCTIWHSPNKDLHEGGVQFFHIDHEDTKQVKIFIPLESIDHNSGPTTIINATNSYNIYKILIKKGLISKRNTKLSNDLEKEYFKDDQYIKLTTEFGKLAFVDTNRCYHFGGRPSSKKRLLLHLHYTSFTADFLPLFIRSKVHYPSHASKKDYLFKPFYAYAPHMTKK